VAIISGAPRSPNRRGEGARLRVEIVHAATGLAEENSDLSGITLRAVARRAGITAPSIYAHFGNLDDVIDAVIASTFEDLVRSLEHHLHGHTDPIGRLRALCHGYVSFGSGNPRLYRLLFGPDRPQPTSLTTKSIDSMPGAKAFAMLVGSIHACIEAGQSSSTDPQRDAIALWAALHGYVGLLAGTPEFPWPPHDGVVDQFVDRLAYLTPRPGATIS
jgi:AcrR family transcriptional regulator